MSRKIENNDEFVMRLMTFGCPTGALVQPFIMQAIEYYAAKCIELGPETFESGLLSGEAWVATAKHVKEELDKRYQRV